MQGTHKSHCGACVSHNVIVTSHFVLHKDVARLMEKPTPKIGIARGIITGQLMAGANNGNEIIN